MKDTADKMKALKEIFPEDERLRNATLMAMGCCEQIPVMNEAFRVQLLDLPAPETTIEWESLTYLALADVLRWSAQLELALQDLRAALFFRYNARIKKTDIPTPEELAQASAAAEEEAKRSAARKTAKTISAAAVPPKKEPKPKPDSDDPTPPSSRISSLFGDLGKRPK